MPESYLPSREGDLDRWAATFDTLITATPTAYGLVAGQATAFATLFNTWRSAYILTTANATRTPASIEAKNTAKAAMVDGPGGIRQLVNIIQAFPALTNEQRSELGITIRDNEPTPIPVPTDAPEIDFLTTGTRTIRIRLHNDNTLNRRKPAGVKGATVFYHVGASAPVDLTAWTFCENTTKNVLDVNLPPSVESGSTVWFTAFWRNPKDQSGPATTPKSTVMQWGGLSMAA